MALTLRNRSHDIEDNLRCDRSERGFDRWSTHHFTIWSEFFCAYQKSDAKLNQKERTKKGKQWRWGIKELKNKIRTSIDEILTITIWSEFFCTYQKSDAKLNRSTKERNEQDKIGLNSSEGSFSTVVFFMFRSGHFIKYKSADYQFKHSFLNTFSKFILLFLLESKYIHSFLIPLAKMPQDLRFQFAIQFWGPNDHLVRTYSR